KKETQVHKQSVRFSLSKVSMNSKGMFILALTVLIVMSLFMFSATASTTNGDSLMDGETIVAVGAGDTLWDIAKHHYSNTSDISYIVYLIKYDNQLESATITPGQQLILPSL